MSAETRGWRRQDQHPRRGEDGRVSRSRSNSWRGSP